MKKLQNNFTTPEQSKRLLEIGVPIGSADGYYSCYINHSGYTDKSWHRPRFMTEDNKITDWNSDKVKSLYLPFWSVGRLMEIITMCHLSRDGRFCYRKDMCESLVETICGFIKYGEMDFSKLEE